MRKLEVLVDAAVPHKKKAEEFIQLSGKLSEAWSIQRGSQNVKSLHSGTHESTWQRVEPSLPKNHEDHIAGKAHNSMTHYKFITMPQAMKILDAKWVVDKGWKKVEMIPEWQLENVKRKKEVVLEAQKKTRRKSTLVHWWTYIILKMRSWNQSFRITKVESYFEETLWKTTPEPTQYSGNKAHPLHKRLPRKEWVSLQDYQTVMGKQLMQYPHTHK